MDHHVPCLGHLEKHQRSAIIIYATQLQIKKQQKICVSLCVCVCVKERKKENCCVYMCSKKKKTGRERNSISRVSTMNVKKLPTAEKKKSTYDT